MLGGFVTNPEPPPAATYNLKVVKVDGVWRVVDASDYSKRKVKVKRKDKIVWKAEGSDVYFQFSNKLFNAVDEADTLSGGYTTFLRDGRKLKLKVKDDAPSGTYEYAVFCTADGVFAQGESPPKIVIE
jgi:hypothetical protein